MTYIYIYVIRRLKVNFSRRAVTLCEFSRVWWFISEMKRAKAVHVPTVWCNRRRNPSPVSRLNIYIWFWAEHCSLYCMYCVISLLYLPSTYGTRGTVVRIMTALRAGGSGVRIPVSSPKRLGRLWGPPCLLLCGYRGFSLGVQRPGREVNL